MSDHADTVREGLPYIYDHDPLCQSLFAHTGLPCNCDISRREAALAALDALVADRDLLKNVLERQVEGVGSIPAHIALKLDFARSDFADAEAEMAAELEYVGRFLTDAVSAARAALKDETP